MALNTGVPVVSAEPFDCGDAVAHRCVALVAAAVREDVECLADRLMTFLGAHGRGVGGELCLDQVSLARAHRLQHPRAGAVHIEDCHAVLRSLDPPRGPADRVQSPPLHRCAVA